MLTRRIQLQAISDLLHHRNGKGLLPSADFGPVYRLMYEAVLEAEPGNEMQALSKFLNDREDGETLFKAVMGVDPSEKPVFPSLAQLAQTLPPVEWLWPGWVPRGMMTLMGSISGGGKSLVALDLCNRVLDGGTFPDGAAVPVAGTTVVYVDAEVIPQMINERVDNWGMDKDRFFPLWPPSDDAIDFAKQVWQDRLVEMIFAVQPELVVIDSMSSISSGSENAIEDVRAILRFLNAIAVDFNCSLLLIHHLRKRGVLAPSSNLSLDEFRGSGHIVAMARSVLGLSIVQTGPEIDRNGPRRLEVIKTNLGRYPQPIGVDFLPLAPKGVLVQYGSVPAQYHEPTKLDKCVDWLRVVLRDADEPLAPKEIVDLAALEGYSRQMVYNARGRLSNVVKDTVGRKSPDNKWVYQLYQEYAVQTGLGPSET